jgi:colanic acid/amylovoran biosynthesis glycosyltransferase
VTDTVDALPPPEDECGEFRLAYVMTHYPRVALTFIKAEIDAMRELGLTVLPIAMNMPDEADLPTDAYRQDAAGTVYLKASRASVTGSCFAATARHPLLMLRLAWLAVTSSRGDLPVLARRLAHLAYATRAAQACKAQGVTHIHAHFGQAPATIAWFTRELINSGQADRCQWSFTIHGFQDFVETNSSRLDLKAGSAAFIACISDFTRAQLCQATDPEYWGRFHVVRCGIDPRALSKRPQQRFRPVPRIIVVGRLSPEKGHLILLEALGILAERGIEMGAQFVGDGPFAATLRRETNRLNLTDMVEFAGEQLPGRVAELLGDADIFCLPSFSEGLPVSLMEAMAKGVPVVTTWISGIPELARDGVTALTVPAGNAQALAAALERLSSDEALQNRLAEAARTAVERQHDARENARTMASLFQGTHRKRNHQSGLDGASPAPLPARPTVPTGGA